MYPMPDHIDPAATLESLMTFSDGLTCFLRIPMKRAGRTGLKRATVPT